MMIIRSRAPLRLGLAGGGTDVSPFCDLYGGYVLNVTIDKYAYATVRTSGDGQVKFSATDRGTEECFDLNLPIVSEAHKLHAAIYNYIFENYNDGKFIPLEISTYSDAPPGSGLGSSSTIVVAVIKALDELLNLSLDDYAIANLAHKIEREICGLQGGKQDQFSAAFGGFNFMEFYADGRSIVNPLRIKEWITCELESSLVLYYMGISRESAKIIADQSSNVEMALPDTLRAMHGIKEEALLMKECLLKGDFDGLVYSMLKGWENKKLSAKTVSNSYIDELYGVAIKAGAKAGKVSGAGGGGFMAFLVPPENRKSVTDALGVYGGEVSNCHFTHNGSQSWRVK